MQTPKPETLNSNPRPELMLSDKGSVAVFGFKDLDCAAPGRRRAWGSGLKFLQGLQEGFY